MDGMVNSTRKEHNCTLTSTHERDNSKSVKKSKSLIYSRSGNQLMPTMSHWRHNITSCQQKFFGTNLFGATFDNISSTHYASHEIS